MRLSNKEIAIIKEKISAIFGDAVIYLFGSRIDDAKKGGDIDLYIIPQTYEDIFKKKMKIKTLLEDALYKPVDIVIAKNNKRLIEQEALKGLKLS
ncbi:MAG: nucleotidyltransferase domain-containing protein [Helicobacteraceae bacterium]|nr:nucleotidyltransferase domain-containing protein [Helicobacteraceae bacterium]